MGDASDDAAVAAAARDVLVPLVPTHYAQVEAVYQQRLAAIPNGESKQRGVAASDRA